MQDLRTLGGSKKRADLEVNGAPYTPMPAVGARRSTRAFVPRTSSKAVGVDSAASVVLRSGKRLVVSKPTGKKVEADGCRGEWMRLFGWQKEELDCTAGRDACGEGGPEQWTEKELLHGSVAETGGATKLLSSKKFGLFYTRKRRRKTVSDDASDREDAKDRRFGLSFTRRKQRRTTTTDSSVSKNASLALSWRVGAGFLEIPCTTAGFAVDVGLAKTDVWEGKGDLAVLLVLVDVSDCRSLNQFSCFLVSTVNGMRRKRVKLLSFSSFMLSGKIASVFSNHGVHFLPVKWDSYISCRNSTYGTGICGIFGTQMFVPLLSVSFSALPFYFQSLHLGMLLNLRARVLSRYSPWEGRLVDFSEVEVLKDECLHTHSDTNRFKDTDVDNMLVDQMTCDVVNTRPVNSRLSRLEDTRVLEDPKLVVQNDAAHWMKFRRHKKKRTSLRTSRVRNSCISSISKRAPKVTPAVKDNPPQLNIVVPSFQGVTESCCPSDFSGANEDHAVSSPISHNQELKTSSHKRSADIAKELKSTLSLVKQKIDTICAKANILITETDRCWREEGAEVMLKASNSNEWCLAVKVNDSIRYLYKAHEMKLSAPNRYTNAMIWNGENGWKLEFPDRMHWLIFKELHRECSYRNSSSQDGTLKNISKKLIPVPVVRVVPGYEEVRGTFIQPESYIKATQDEFERALMSENSYYDMDSGDEEWLEHLNSTIPGEGSSSHLSDDNFEKIIFSLEKTAYYSPDVVSNAEKAISSCLTLGNKDVLVAIFDYWSKRKRQKRTALARIFQELPKKAQASQKLLRKKRSFKRQGSHAGRGKPDFYLQAGAMKEETRQVEEAKRAASAAMDVAIRLRSRVQILMANADLATYKATLALRLAEAIQESASPDLASSLLD